MGTHVTFEALHMHICHKFKFAIISLLYNEHSCMYFQDKHVVIIVNVYSIDRITEIPE